MHSFIHCKIDSVNATDWINLKAISIGRNAAKNV